MVNMKIFIYFLLMLFSIIGCTKKEISIGNEVKNTNKIVDQNGNNLSIQEIMYVNALEGLRVRKEPSIESEKIFLLNDKEKVFILEKKLTENEIDGIKGNWFLIKTPEIVGWVFSGYLVNKNELIVKNKGMNDIFADAIYFQEKKMNPIEVELIGYKGRYKSEFDEYEMNVIYIDYWSRTKIFDKDIYEDYDPDQYIQMEEKIKNGDNDFKSIFFNQNRRVNNKNNITFVDSFCFGIYDYSSILLNRPIYLSTNNYNIRITFEGKSDFSRQMVDEAPKYFKIHSSEPDDVDYYKFAEWNYDNGNKPKALFGDDIINGRHESKTVNDLFIETERILNVIKLK